MHFWICNSFGRFLNWINPSFFQRNCNKTLLISSFRNLKKDAKHFNSFYRISFLRNILLAWTLPEKRVNIFAILSVISMSVAARFFDIIRDIFPISRKKYTFPQIFPRISKWIYWISIAEIAPKLASFFHKSKGKRKIRVLSALKTHFFCGKIDNYFENWDSPIKRGESFVKNSVLTISQNYIFGGKIWGPLSKTDQIWANKIRSKSECTFF